MLVSASAESGVVADDEEEMLHAVFDLGETLVRQVMVPRTEVVAVPAESTIKDLIDVAVRQPHTKMPVYEGDLDHIVGVVHVKDVLRAFHGDHRPTESVRAIMREAIFIPESARINALLRRFRARKQQIAIVLDEYGGTGGVVTLEDLLEEIVGEVGDPFAEGPDIQPQPDGTSLIEGLTPIQEVNEHFGLTLRDPHYDTIAGFVLGRLGRMAQIGDVILVDGVRLRVEALDGRRIARISLAIQRSVPPPQTGEAD
jgi:CBS domain containing-hemolysin-like protein